MTLLLVLTKSGHVERIEDFKTPGLANQQAAAYADRGVLSRVVPDELREDCEHLMSQIKEKREKGFVEEYGIVPNGRRAKKTGARGLGRMIYPAFGGILEGDEVRAKTPETPPPPIFSSNETEVEPEKIDDSLVMPRYRWQEKGT
jgi:hypothetical protein